MTDRRIVEAVHRLFCVLHPELQTADQFFPGVTVIFGGDWHQTLPIIEDISDMGVYSYTLKSSSIWRTIEVRFLK